jgi:hypothetical protein
MMTQQQLQTSLPLHHDALQVLFALLAVVFFTLALFWNRIV